MRKQTVSFLLKGATRLMIVVAFVILTMSPVVVQAATNQGFGDIGGDTTDLTDSNIFNLSTTTLALVKQAFLASDGSAILDGASLPKGTLVKFLIYINNTTSFVVNDVSIRDTLNGAFSYQAGTLKVNNTTAECAGATCTAPEELTIFNDVDAVAFSTDIVDLDVVSIAGAVIDAGNQNVGNALLNIAADSVFALSFTVEMQ